ncbi:CbtA family protein [Gordonia sp. MP11Mi]|uniref:Cobalt transporter n=1 Tax=Gordonia sp. MP11Mi TaxID=3022769 RepID=A0AA97CU61_9ACTN
MERKFIGAGLLSGLIAGLIAYAYARIFIEPQVAKAIDYEGVRSEAESMLSGEHEHEHELFTRSVQENIGAGVGTVVFALSIGALFAVAFTVAWAYVGRRRPSTDPRALAAVLAGIAFVAVIAIPFFVYPPNPPAVGDEDTIGSRSSSYLTITIVSIVLAIVGVLIATSLSSRIGAWSSSVVGAVVYLIGVTITASLLPEFKEVPGPVMDGDRIVAPGFPGQVVADFRVYAIANQVLLWAVLTTVFIGLLGLMMRRTRSISVAAESISA